MSLSVWAEATIENANRVTENKISCFVIYIGCKENNFLDCRSLWQDSTLTLKVYAYVFAFAYRPSVANVESHLQWNVSIAEAIEDR